MSIPKIDFTFHNNTSTTGTGIELSNKGGDYSAVMIEVVATNTFSVTFEGQGSSGTWKTIACINTKTKEVASTTTDKTVFWLAEINGYVGLRVNLTVNTGTVSIHGRVMG